MGKNFLILYSLETVRLPVVTVFLSSDDTRTHMSENISSSSLQ